MNLIIAIDDRCAMQFNNRRQSRDGKLCCRILELAGDSRLWIRPESEELFGEQGSGCIAVSTKAPEEAQQGEFFFAERPPLWQVLPRVEKFFVYRWNRTYPGDVFPDLRPWETEGWELESTCDFPGSSHERITEEVYIRTKEVTGVRKNESES